MNMSTNLLTSLVFPTNWHTSSSILGPCQYLICYLWPSWLKFNNTLWWAPHGRLAATLFKKMSCIYTENWWCFLLIQECGEAQFKKYNDMYDPGHSCKIKMKNDYGWYLNIIFNANFPHTWLTTKVRWGWISFIALWKVKQMKWLLHDKHESVKHYTAWSI